MSDTYSFLDVQAALAGPTGALAIGAGSQNAEEGITIEPNEDVGTLTIGADGGGMHSLHGNRSGKVILRYLKTAPINSRLSAMYLAQTQSALLYGQNVISIFDRSTGDTIVCTGCGFARAPTINYAKLGGMMEWSFNAITIDRKLGGGSGSIV